MKIAISGYGKMGKEVEKAAIKKGYSIVAIVDNQEDWKEQLTNLQKADVVIDFSEPNAVVDIILKSLVLHIPIVTGTTGWQDHLKEISRKCGEFNGALFYAPNFSVGVNIFFKINRELAKIMNHIEGYQLTIKETHHTQKLDAPSGTAIKAAEDIIQNIDELKNWVNHSSNVSAKLSIISKRKGKVTGTHKVRYSSEMDEIELVHKARNRAAFANGALLAAEFIQKKQGVYTMEDLLNF